jgi:nucleolin
LYLTDQHTGKFYGSAFCEVKTSHDAAKAVTELNGTKLMGRPIKINYAPIKPGQEADWPPKQRVVTGGKVANSAGQAGGQGIKAMSVKPEGCCKLFIGNLSYDLDDDAITKFFMAVDAEIKAIRWLHHKDSGDFKGCGYIDFWSSEACEKAASLNGKNLLGRPIRIDWAE